MLNTVEFDLKSLLKIEGGKLGEAIKQDLAKLVADMNDRPGLPDARKLMIELSFKPRVDNSGVSGGVVCDGAVMRFKLKTVVPHRESANISLGMDETGLTVNVESPDNVDQHTMEFGDEKDVKDVE